MTWKLKGLAALSLGMALACGSKDADDTGASNDDTQPGDDTAVSGDDSDNGDTSFGEVFERGDPSYTVNFNGSLWSSSTGYYLGNTSSFINATGGDSSRSQTVTIEVDGNVRYADTYPVKSITYAEGPAQGSVDVNYSVTNPSGVTFTVQGFAEETYLFGELNGTATLTDTIGGGGSADFTGLVIESWPKF
ncbi:MAG: hypothetical protein H6741_02655 [Alphaproteobacteria bacterium]|nr:hypothetical protein [Alphaproteobacteria bacterium]MCB9791605.1 hypothetical protein [Alphaproteobacteria bacterium]